ncbi:16S rRNA (adenine(1518)-N(6)/adenine(1519)-N(6))-dimethyltransferase RsmA [Bythopirellula polymerisocia]|uniref:Ribosomal RNA small subunit methyltransferase A n=1 Tax=Bythopirellula polymerisocia TaxID=2528003 RepID=A0A5C6CL27_9BACT|nr:16S rRNA (adenine(1518)-N(6)/adenine(1519)-N(6))-dimethyltransferase RsmA [Bythopirellula polymerisocia]TWU23529.1 Ribosomal RNA adenine dimethylase [Bythopirellula polymerisocia]
MSRQTKTFLMNRFREMGISPATRHGQNFLIDLNLHRVIIDAADLTNQDVVLEVGTGTGALTTLMAEKAAAVITVEIDGHLFELASEHLIDYPHVTMLHIDALKNKNHFDSRVMEAVGERLAEAPDSRFKLVANLPYNIATPVLSNLLLCEHVPHTMVATIQKELGDRIVAQPWSRDYGALSVWMQCQADAEIVRLMPPTVFWPMPKVDSAIVRIVVDPVKRNSVPDLRFFHQFVKAIFIHRRKFLRANVVAALKHHLSKTEVDEILAEMQLSEEARTEQLDVPTLLKLTELVRARAPGWTL